MEILHITPREATESLPAQEPSSVALTFGNSTRFIAEGLAPGVTYSFKVQALNMLGAGAYSGGFRFFHNFEVLSMNLHTCGKFYLCAGANASDIVHCSLFIVDECFTDMNGIAEICSNRINQSCVRVHLLKVVSTSIQIQLWSRGPLCHRMYQSAQFFWTRLSSPSR